jgi:hypothetical protein
MAAAVVVFIFAVIFFITGPHPEFENLHENFFGDEEIIVEIPPEEYAEFDEGADEPKYEEWVGFPYMNPNMEIKDFKIIGGEIYPIDAEGGGEIFVADMHFVFTVYNPTKEAITTNVSFDIGVEDDNYYIADTMINHEGYSTDNFEDMFPTKVVTLLPEAESDVSIFVTLPYLPTNLYLRNPMIDHVNLLNKLPVGDNGYCEYGEGWFQSLEKGGEYSSDCKWLLFPTGITAARDIDWYKKTKVVSQHRSNKTHYIEPQIRISFRQPKDTRGKLADEYEMKMYIDNASINISEEKVEYWHIGAHEYQKIWLKNLGGAYAENYPGTHNLKVIATSGPYWGETMREIDFDEYECSDYEDDIEDDEFLDDLDNYVFSCEGEENIYKARYFDDKVFPNEVRILDYDYQMERGADYGREVCRIAIGPHNQWLERTQYFKVGNIKVTLLDIKDSYCYILIEEV